MLDLEHLATYVPSTVSVDLVVGKVPQTLPNALAGQTRIFTATANAVLIELDTNNRMLITPDQIMLDEAVEPQVAPYLIYSWGVRNLLALRNIFSLHASAVTSSGVTYAVMGTAFAGKTTTVIELAARGYDLVVDDLLLVNPGPPLRCSGWNRPVHVRPETQAAYPDIPQHPGKVLLPGDWAMVAPAPMHEYIDQPLGHIFVLNKSPDLDEPRAQELTGIAKFQYLETSSDRRGRQASGGRAGAFFTWATAICDQVPMTEITRPTSGWTTAAVADLIEQTIRPSHHKPERGD